VRRADARQVEGKPARAVDRNVGGGLTDVRTSLQGTAGSPDMMRFCLTGAQGAVPRQTDATDAAGDSGSEDVDGLKAWRHRRRDDISERGGENGVPTMFQLTLARVLPLWASDAATKARRERRCSPTDLMTKLTGARPLPCARKNALARASG